MRFDTLYMRFDVFIWVLVCCICVWVCVLCVLLRFCYIHFWRHKRHGLTHDAMKIGGGSMITSGLVVFWSLCRLVSGSWREGMGDEAVNGSPPALESRWRIKRVAAVLSGENKGHAGQT